MKTNFNSGFSVLGLVLGMVAVLAIGGGAGYMYLNSTKGESKQESQELADFAAGDTVKNTAESSDKSEPNDSEERAENTEPVSTLDNSSDGQIENVVGSTGKEIDCGVGDNSSQTDPAYECYMKALTNCSPAKLTLNSLVAGKSSSVTYKVEGKSGQKCVVSNPGHNLDTLAKLTLKCSFSDKLVPELLNSAIALNKGIPLSLKDKVPSPYFVTFFAIHDKTRYEGSSTILYHSDGFTKVASDGTIAGVGK